MRLPLRSICCAALLLSITAIASCQNPPQLPSKAAAVVPKAQSGFLQVDTHLMREAFGARTLFSDSGNNVKSGVTSYRLRVEGADMSTVVSASAPWVGANNNNNSGGPPVPSVSPLAVPSGLNRLVTFEALSADGHVIARVMGICSIDAGSTTTLSLSPLSDAAGHVLYFLLHGQAGDSADADGVVAGLKTSDLATNLTSLLTSLTGYRAGANTYTIANPATLNTWLLADLLRQNGTPLLSRSSSDTIFTSVKALPDQTYSVSLTASGTPYTPSSGYQTLVQDPFENATGAAAIKMRPGNWEVEVIDPQPGGTRIGWGSVTLGNPSTSTAVTVAMDAVASTTPTTPWYAEENERIQNPAVGQVATGAADMKNIAASFGQIYYTDMSNNRVFYAAASTTASRVATLLAGTGTQGELDGALTTATFNQPQGIAVNPNTNDPVYVADRGSGTIRKIAVGAQTVSTLATNVWNPNGSVGNGPVALALGGTNNATLYVLDGLRPRVLKVDTTSGAVTLLAGSGDSALVNGTGSAAAFLAPKAIAADTSGNVYVADDDEIRKITAGGVVSLFAGGARGDVDGTGSACRFDGITALCCDVSGDLYVGENDNHRIRMLTPQGVCVTLAGGASAPGTFSSGTYPGVYNVNFAQPALSIDAGGNLFVTSYESSSGNDALYEVNTTPPPS